MNLIVSMFLCFILVSSGLSNPINEHDTSFLDELITHLDKNLSMIENDLIKKKLEQEVVEIKSNRALLTGSVRDILIKADEFSIKYQKYWNKNPIFAPSLVINKLNRKMNGGGGFPATITDIILFLKDNWAFNLMRIQIGLTRDHLTDEANNAEKLRTILKADVETVVEKSDDFLEKYMRQPDEQIDDDEAKAAKEINKEVMKGLILEKSALLEKMENNLRKDNKIVEADEIKSLIPLFNQELVDLEFKVFDLMFKYMKYWYHDDTQSMMNRKDFFTILFMMRIRGQARAMKKCNTRLLEDKKEGEAKEALKLKEEILNKVIPPFETAFWMVDYYMEYMH